MATMTLRFEPPLDWPGLAGFLASRGATGVEQAGTADYWRSLRIGEQTGWIHVSPCADNSSLSVEYSDSLRPERVRLKTLLRNLFDLDASPREIQRHLAADPVLKAMIAKRPGIRVPGAVDGFELALRAVLGQQISVRAASTVFGRFAARFGEPVADAPIAEIGLLAPCAQSVAAASHAELIALGLTGRRAATVQALSREMVEQGLRLEPGVDLATTRQRLIDLPGIGPWTASYIAMRALRDADAFPEADLGLMKALGVTRPPELVQRAQAWSPWRAYAAITLWAGIGAGG